MFTKEEQLKNNKEKAEPKRLKRTRIKYKPVKEKYNFYGFNNQTELFIHKWVNARDAKGHVRCELSGELLTNLHGTDLWYSIFSHILSKGLYPKLKLHPDNIIILAPRLHFLYDHGTEVQRLKEYPNVDWSILTERKYKMLELYKTL